MGFYAALYLVIGLGYAAMMEYLLVHMTKSEDENEKMHAEAMMASPGAHGFVITVFILAWPVWILCSVFAAFKRVDI